MEEELKMAKRLISVCCEEGSLTLLKSTLTKYPYLVNEPDPRGLAPLAIAIKNSQYDVAHFLYSQGADVDTTNKSKQSILFWAAANNRMRAAQYLLQRGWTPLTVAAAQGHKEMVKLLLKHNPDLTITDKFGKKIYEKAKTPEIASIIQSATLGTQFMKSPTLNDFSTLGKTTSSADPIKTGLFNTAKKELNKMVQTSGNEKVGEMVKAYMEKMKAKIGKALTKELETALVTQVTKTAGELRKYMGDDFLAGSGKVVKGSLQLFNLKMQEALEKHGIEPTADMLLSNEDINNEMQIREGEILCTEPNNATIIDTLKLLSKTPGKVHRRPLSPKVTSPQRNTAEVGPGICMMSYVGAMFEKMGQEMLNNLTNKLNNDMENALEMMKASFLSANNNSFEKLSKDIENKLSTLLSEKLTRISKSIREKVQKAESAKRSRVLAASRSQERLEIENTEGSRLELAEKFRSARASRKSCKSTQYYQNLNGSTERKSFGSTISMRKENIKAMHVPFNLENAAPHEAKIRPTTACSNRDEKVTQLRRKQMYLLRTLNPNQEADFSTLERIQKLNTEESSTFNKMLDSLTQRVENVDKKPKLYILHSAKEVDEYGPS